MKRSLLLIAISGFCAISSAQAELYNCNGVWTNRKCAENAKPVTDLPTISRFDAETGQIIRDRRGEGRAALAVPERQPAVTPVPSNTAPMTVDAALQNIAAQLPRVEQAARFNDGKASVAQRERIRLLAQLNAICSPDNIGIGDSRLRRECTDLNNRVQRIGR